MVKINDKQFKKKNWWKFDSRIKTSQSPLRRKNRQMEKTKFKHEVNYEPYIITGKEKPICWADDGELFMPIYLDTREIEEKLNAKD